MGRERYFIVLFFASLSLGGQSFTCFSVLFIKFIFKGQSTSFKYQSQGKLFSPAEHTFFLVLKQAISDDFEIFAKVRIADILIPDQSMSRRNQASAFYKISSKHFDYILCDKNTLDVVAVIELDDKSHNLDKVRARDVFVEKSCKTAGLKLLRFPCKSRYQVKSVHKKIINSLNDIC